MDTFLNRVANPFMMAMLRSPLHGMFDKGLILLTYTGRKSGKQFAVPVNYLRDGDVLLTVTFQARTWWRNLRGGAPVTVCLEGREARAYAEALTEPAAVAEGLAACVRADARRAALYGVKLGADGRPDPEGLRRAAETRVVVRTWLT